MQFRRAVQRYGRAPEPVTPYQKAAQVWDDRIGSARVQARNWRLMAFGGLILSGALAGGLLWQSMESRIVPYVVAVDRLGEARAVAPANIDYHPTDPEIAWFLARFISDIRSVSLDPVLMRQDWLSAYDFATARGARFLNDYARVAEPFADLGTRTVSVQVTSIVRASERSFEVKWTETEFDRGNLVGTSRWTAILTVTTRRPANAEVLRRNPLGLYVDAIDWSKELDPAQAPVGPNALPSRSGPATIPAGSPMGSAFAAPSAPAQQQGIAE